MRKILPIVDLIYMIKTHLDCLPPVNTICSCKITYKNVASSAVIVFYSECIEL